MFSATLGSYCYEVAHDWQAMENNFYPANLGNYWKFLMPDYSNLMLSIAAPLQLFSYTMTMGEPIKKKILVFFSEGGGGHKSGFKALEEYLGDIYEIQGVNILRDILAPLDPVRFLTFDAYTGEDLYNYLLTSRWIWCLDLLSHLGLRRFQAQQPEIEQLMYSYLSQQQPDLIISVMPFINAALANVAKTLNIPFLVIPVDFDTTLYINGLRASEYKNFFYALPFNDPRIKQKILPAHITTDRIGVIGFPVRTDFLEKKDPIKIKREFDIPDSGKTIIMLLMGASGSITTYRYVRRIARMNLPIHLIVCLGRSEKLRHKIEKIRLPEQMSISIIGFTPRISDLMAISDIFITKPGPTSICEALHMSLPMILDNTTHVWWEDLNVEFVKAHHFGDAFTNYHELEELITHYVNDITYRGQLKNRITSYKKGNFCENVRTLVQHMLAEQKSSCIRLNVLPSHFHGYFINNYGRYLLASPHNFPKLTTPDVVNSGILMPLFIPPLVTTYPSPTNPLNKLSRKNLPAFPCGEY